MNLPRVLYSNKVESSEKLFFVAFPTYIQDRISAAKTQFPLKFSNPLVWEEIFM